MSKEILQKRCNVCQKVWSVDKFPRNCKSGDGFGYTCKSCASVVKKESGSSRRMVKKRRLGQLILDEVQGKPTKKLKMVWDGKGLWCQKYPEIDVCVECNTNIFRHHGRGVCKKCKQELYNRGYLRKYNEENKERVNAQKRALGKKRREKIKQTIQDAIDGKIPMTPRLQHLIDSRNAIKDRRSNV